MELMKTPFTVTDPAIMAAAQKEKSIVETRYQMAIYAPRNVEQCRAAILDSCRRPGFADDALWTKKVWDSSKRREVDIHGLNIRFAELALMLWRNISADTRVIFEDSEKIRYQVTVTDYETNGTFAKEFQVSKTVERKKKGAKNRIVVSQRKNNYGDDLYIVVATEQEMVDKTSAIESKIIRNQVLRLLPTDIKEDAKNVILNTITAGITANPDEAKTKILDSFQAIGIMPGEIERFLGHGVNIISPKELADLRIAYTTVKSGERSWHDICPVEEKEVPKPVDKTPKSKAVKRPTPKAEPVSAPGAVTTVEILSVEDLDIFVTIDIGTEFVNSQILADFRAHVNKFEPFIIEQFQGYRVETSQEFADLKAQISEAAKGI